MSKFEPPPGIEIAALKVKQAQDVDLLFAGPGIPWEDRAGRGPVGPYLSTVGKLFTTPRKLYEDIRRTNSTADARPFARISMGLWAAGVLISSIVSVIRSKEPFDIALMLPDIVVLAATPFFVYWLLSMSQKMFNAMVERELKQGTPPSLAGNVFLYATGASFLATILIPIHWAGALVAWFMIGVFAAIGARSRMRLSIAGAVVAVVLSMGTVAVLSGVALFLVRWLYYYVMSA